MKRIVRTAQTVVVGLGVLMIGCLPAKVLAADPFVSFGLTNVPLGQVRHDGEGNWLVSTNRGDGVSFLLGESDSGMFLTPSTPYPENGDYMLAEVYGQWTGGTNQLLATVRGNRDGYGEYAADVDLSPLQPTSLTVEIYLGDQLVQEVTNAGPHILINANWSGARSRRVAPLWRRADGAIGALFEFEAITGLGVTVDLDPSESVFVGGDRLFVRVEHPTNSLEFISRVDVTSQDLPLPVDGDEGVTNYYGTGLVSFRLDDVGLGMFGRPHRAWDSTTLAAKAGTLTVGSTQSNATESVAVELARVSTFDLDLLPVDLAEPESWLAVTAIGTASGEIGTEFGTLAIMNTNESLRISAQFAVAPAFAQIVVLDHGVQTGLLGVTRDLASVEVAGTPRIIGCGLRSRRVEEPAGFVVRLDRSTTFTTSTAETFTGDELRLLAGDPVRFETFETAVLSAGVLPFFTITGESEQPLVVPSLTITSVGTNVVITWPDPNQIFDLESSSSTDEPMVFESVTAPVTFSYNYRAVTLPIAEGSWFFRLRHGPPRHPPPVD